MTWTKQQLIDAAFDEIGIASYTYDVSSDQYTAALRRLDAMMSEWNGNGARLGYPTPSSPQNSLLSDQSGIPDFANEAVILALAVRLAPSYGKTVSPDTRVRARAAYRTVLLNTSETIEMQLPAMPAGAGAKGTDTEVFLQAPADTLDVGGDGELELY